MDPIIRVIIMYSTVIWLITVALFSSAKELSKTKERKQFFIDLLTESNWNLQEELENNKKLANKIRSRDIQIDNLMQDHERKMKDKIEEMNRNGSHQRQLLQDEIDSLITYTKQLKSKIHSEQVRANDKWRSKELWKSKFETLTVTVLNQGFWKEIMAKYKRAFKKKILAYNESHKWTKHN